MSLDYPGEYEEDATRNALGVGDELWWTDRDEGIELSAALALGLGEVWQDYAPRTR